MSEVEVMRVRRQMNDLSLQTAERVNRYRQEASGELVRLRNELSAIQEQMVVRDDALRRTTLLSPVRGVIKQIRANTLGGVVGPGASVMEILPIGTRVLIEARVKPADIGFIRVGQQANVRVLAYDASSYGKMDASVARVGADAIVDERGESYFEVQLAAARDQLKLNGKPLAVTPGMPVDVGILTGKRSVMQYMLKPVLRGLQRSLQER